MIKIKNLTHVFKRMDKEGIIIANNTALDNVSLEINEGEFISIIGHNGSGKSTLARHINGILKPDGGVVTVDDLNTDNEEELWKIRQKTAMVFQNPDNQMVASTVEEEIAFGLENQCIDNIEIKKRIKEVLHILDMENFQKSSPNHLSGGQKQKIVIAAAVVMKPKYIILDEPTAMLDPISRDNIIQILQKLKKEYSIAVILITHFMEEAVASDRVIVMKQGKIELSGPPRKIFSQLVEMPEYRASVPTVTRIAYELRKDGIPIKETILTKEELVNSLCRLNLKM